MHGPVSRAALALCVLFAAVFLRELLDPVLGDTVPLVTLFGAVAFAVWIGGYRLAIGVALLGYFACDYLFIQPRGRIHLGDPVTFARFITYLFTSAIIIGFGESMRRAREQAKRQEEHWHVTLASIGDAVIATDAEGRIVYLNAVAQELTGWTLKEATGQALDDVFRIINESTREPAKNPVHRVLAEGVIVGLANHTLLIAKDGTERPIDDSAAPIRDGSGQVSGCVLIFRDVTERRRVERALSRNERDLSDFFENASIGLHQVGPDGIIRRVNRTELEMLGYTREEFVGRHIAEFHADQTVIADIFERLTRGETIQDYPARLIHKNGLIIEVAINSSVLFEDGKFLHTRCFTRDVSRQRQAETALRDSEAQLRLIMNGTPGLIAFIDSDLRYRFVNHQYEVWFDTNGKDLVGTPVIDVLGDEAMERLRPHMLGALNGVAARFEAEVPYRTGGTRWIDARYIPHRDSEGRIPGFFVLVLDITDRKQAEAAIRDADRRKDEFLAVLAHELRNPLAPLRNSLEILRLAGDDTAAVAHARDAMDRQVLQMERLIDDLMDVSRITRNRLELRRSPVDVAAVVRHAAESGRANAERLGHELAVDVPTEPILLEGDSVRLSQVFGNLLNNACKYTPPGGRIAITVRHAGREAIISVSDNGMGLEPEMQSRIFDMFTQVDASMERSHGGLGIGLTLVKQLVELHGGRVEVSSAGLGSGSTFHVRLPMPAEPLALPKAPGPAKQPASRRRVLVVDDNRDGADSLAMLLNLAGHETRLAFDGFEAIAAAEEYRPDVVLLDLGLPKMNGYDTCRSIRSLPGGREAIIIATTGWGQEEDRRKSTEAGFDAHLVKPVEFDRLTALLAEPRRAGS
jgi:PAS domain S-box-containing protein